MPRIGASLTELPVGANRKIDTGDGLQGGGDLNADRTLSVRFGAAADTVARGTDTRLSDARAWSLYGGGSPTEGQALVFSTSSGKYVPGVVAGQTLDAEQVRDIVGATLVAGSNVSIVVNDAGDSITIGATGGGGGGASDATTTTNGIVRLAGDLAGTAAAPTVPGAEKLIRKSTNTSKVPDGYIGADSAGNIFRGHLPAATNSLQGSIQLSGDLSGTNTNPTVPSLANKVDKTTRSPVGGHTEITYAANITPNATLANSFFVNCTGALLVYAPTGGVDGQRLIIEFFAGNAAARTITLDPGIQQFAGVPTPMTVPAGKVGIGAMYYSARTSLWYCTAFNTAV